MSSPKGNSNSNKTAHVMNLLRKSNPTPPPAEVPAEEAVAPAAPAPSAAPTAPAPAAAPIAPIITALNADAEISSQIRDALEQELLAEVTPEPAPEPPVPPQSKQEPVPEPIPEPPAPSSGTKMTQEEIEKMLAGFAAEPEPEPEPIPEPPAPSSGTKMTQDEIEKMLAGFVAEAEPELEPEPQPEPMDDSEFFNVMYRLTEEKADRYISMFGLCNCKRCRQDVIALALNGLSPKYVVMPPAEMTVRSDMYSVRHSGEITAQLLHACREVMDHPRHKGQE